MSKTFGVKNSVWLSKDDTEHKILVLINGVMKYGVRYV